MVFLDQPAHAINIDGICAILNERFENQRKLAAFPLRRENIGLPRYVVPDLFNRPNDVPATDGMALVTTADAPLPPSYDYVLIHALFSRTRRPRWQFQKK